MDKEKLIAQIIAEYEKDGEPISREDAEEIAEMEIKAKGIKNYTQGEKPKQKKKVERKVDNTKLVILNALEKGLYEILGISSTKENEVKLHFMYDNDEYTLNLVRHRKR